MNVIILLFFRQSGHQGSIEIFFNFTKKLLKVLYSYVLSDAKQNTWLNFGCSLGSPIKVD